MLGRGSVDHEQGDQHEHRTAHRVEHEIQGGPVPALATPLIDQEEQRDQRQLPEHVEKRPVTGEEHAQHPEFQTQESNVVAARPGAAQARQQGHETEEGREQHQRQRETVYSQGIETAHAGIPGQHFAELDVRRVRLETDGDEQGQQQTQAAEPQGDAAGVPVPMAWQEGQYQSARKGRPEKAAQCFHDDRYPAGLPAAPRSPVLPGTVPATRRRRLTCSKRMANCGTSHLGLRVLARCRYSLMLFSGHSSVPPSAPCPPSRRDSRPARPG
ncbi:hypothetical protein [Plasmodium yoelii yoelii]|uniref:Uncharacterized protein n=1 Tax=Plasmodium yoelii yoelii TaxID=73239 RepID=Q7R6Y2_PLAYO|nr:hypothetical protein [Plasmodium yoelii yoelii]